MVRCWVAGYYLAVDLPQFAVEIIDGFVDNLLEAAGL